MAGPTAPAAPRCRARTCGWSPPPAGPESSYHPQGYNRYFFDAFLPPYEQTAALCGMRFLPPLLLHGARRASEQAVAAHVEVFAQRLRSYPALARDWTSWANARPARCPADRTGPATPRPAS